MVFFNTSDCARWTEPLPDYANLSSYRFLTADKHDYETSLVRLDLFGKFKKFETITFDDIIEAHGIDEDMNAAVMIKMMERIDKNGDRRLTWEEIYAADLARLIAEFGVDLDKVLAYSDRIRISLKNKSATSLVTALKSTLTKGWPKTLQTDKGLEFLNRSVQALLKKYGIHRFSTHNEETKESIVERFNRTLKMRMLRETPDAAIHRRPSRLCGRATTPPPQHWHGSVTGECEESRRGVAAPVRSRHIPCDKSSAHQKVKVN
ncbi:hypothetical protein LSAT2_016684 [Lamellibrachia satsuma]|nr:hypothetical protein LSAT2_016684 [Lamellibrachia satsuma]